MSEENKLMLLTAYFLIVLAVVICSPVVPESIRDLARLTYGAFLTALLRNIF